VAGLAFELPASVVNQIFVCDEADAAVVLLPTDAATQLLQVDLDHVVLQKHFGAEDPVALVAADHGRGMFCTLVRPEHVFPLELLRTFGAWKNLRTAIGAVRNLGFSLDLGRVHAAVLSFFKIFRALFRSLLTDDPLDS